MRMTFLITQSYLAIPWKACSELQGRKQDAPLTLPAQYLYASEETQ